MINIDGITCDLITCYEINFWLNSLFSFLNVIVFCCLSTLTVDANIESLNDNVTMAMLKGMNNSTFVHKNTYKSQGETGFYSPAFQHSHCHVVMQSL